MTRELIRSRQNQEVKDWIRLHQAKHRRRQARYLVDGSHLVQEAMDYDQAIQELIVTESYLTSGELKDRISDYPYRVIEDHLAEDISQMPAPQGIFAVIDTSEASDLTWTGQRYLLVDGIQDPGNLGTMIRTADACAYDAVLLGRGTVDLYNDKVLRATQGSLWHLPVRQVDLEVVIPELQAQGVHVWATDLSPESQDYRSLDTDQPLALVLGNEGQGVTSTLLDQADGRIYIPMPGQAESLNVGVAAGVLMFATLCDA